MKISRIDYTAETMAVQLSKYLTVKCLKFDSSLTSLFFHSATNKCHLRSQEIVKIVIYPVKIYHLDLQPCEIFSALCTANDYITKHQTTFGSSSSSSSSNLVYYTITLCHFVIQIHNRLQRINCMTKEIY